MLVINSYFHYSFTGCHFHHGLLLHLLAHLFHSRLHGATECLQYIGDAV